MAMKRDAPSHRCRAIQSKLASSCDSTSKTKASRIDSPMMFMHSSHRRTVLRMCSTRSATDPSQACRCMLENGTAFLIPTPGIECSGALHRSLQSHSSLSSQSMSRAAKVLNASMFTAVRSTMLRPAGPAVAGKPSRTLVTTARAQPDTASTRQPPADVRLPMLIRQCRNPCRRRSRRM